MKIEKATDWQIIHNDLKTELFVAGYNPDLKKMLDNITKMVTELSKAEVEARRLHNVKYLEAPLEKINAAIKHLEQFLLMAKLMK